MMKKLIVFFVLFFIAGGVLFTTIVPSPVFAADIEGTDTNGGGTTVTTCNSVFLGFPAWYRGLTNSSCEIMSPGNNLGGFIWKVALNVIEMAMMAVAYVAVFFILYGGFQFLTSQGSPEGSAKARTTILNAVIGLVISLVAVGIINFIVKGLLI